MVISNIRCSNARLRNDQQNKLDKRLVSAEDLAAFVGHSNHCTLRIQLFQVVVHQRKASFEKLFAIIEELQDLVNFSLELSLSQYPVSEVIALIASVALLS